MAPNLRKILRHGLVKILPACVRSRIRLATGKVSDRFRYYLIVERCLRNGLHKQLNGLDRELELVERHLNAVNKVKCLVRNHSMINLELGGGNNKREGWLNIDLFTDKADLQLDLRRRLPFPNLSVDNIYSSHVLEHFSYPEPLRSLLRECFRVLKVGGIFSAAVLDARRAFQIYAAGEYEFYQQKYWVAPQPNWCKSPMDDINWLVYMGGLHQHMFDIQNLVTRLEEVGFSKVLKREFDEDLDIPARHHQSIYIEAIKEKQDPFITDQATLCKYNDAAAYDSLWEDRALSQRYAEPGRIALWHRIAGLCVGRFGSILDIGCGGGHLLEILTKEPGRHMDTVHGIDYSVRAIEQAQERISLGHFYKHDVTDLWFPDESFDTVICCHTLEHTSNPAQIFAEAFRVLTSNGRLIIAIPNGAKDDYEGHIHYWDEDEFRRFCMDYPLAHYESFNEDTTLIFVFEK